MSSRYNCGFRLYFLPQEAYQRKSSEAFKNFGLKLCKIIAETNGNDSRMPIPLEPIQKEFDIKGNFIDSASVMQTFWTEPFLENIDTTNAHIELEGCGSNSKVWRLFEAIIREHYSDPNGKPLIHMDVVSYDFKHFEFINTNPSLWSNYRYAAMDKPGVLKNPRIVYKEDLAQYISFEYKPDFWHEVYPKIDTVETLADLINEYFNDININLFEYKDSM